MDTEPGFCHFLRAEDEMIGKNGVTIKNRGNKELYKRK